MLALLLSTLLAAAQDARQVPGPWENHLVALPGRGDHGADLTVHYLEAGPADAPRVLLLHGFPDTSYGWRYVLPLLAQDHHVYAPDLRGYAGTDRPRDGYDLGTLAGDALAFLGAVAQEDGWDPAAPVDLLAHDWGASIGWRVVNDAPARFSSFTTLAVPHLRTLFERMEVDRAQRHYKRFLAQLVTPGAPYVLAGMSLERRAEVFYREELVNDAALRDEDMPIYHAAWDQASEARGPLRYYREIVFHRRPVERYYETAPKIAVPTLVIFAAEDHYMLPPMAALSCQQVSARCESAVVQGAGHYLHWEKPEEVVGLWRSFVAGEAR